MFNRYLAESRLFNLAFHGLIVIFAALCFGIALNFFYIPGDIYSAGILGFAQLIAYVINHFTNIPWQAQTGTINLIINIPLIILGFMKLGKRFTLLTLAVVFATSIISNIIPVIPISSNPMLNGVVGGVLCGTAVGVCVKYGMSTGGLDIVSVVLNRKTGLNVGSLSLIMNSLLLFGVGYVYEWELALYTLIAMYVNSRMVNAINNNDQRLTAFIITENIDDVVSSLYQHIHRGITVIDGRGGYKRSPRKIIMVVINRYELYDLQSAVHLSDPKAFVNIVQSQYVGGNFLNRQQQDLLRERKQTLKIK